MKKFLVSLVMLVVTTLGAHAQFEKDVWYVNASLTGLDLSHSKYEGTNFGFTLGGGAFVADNFAVLLNFKGQYVEHGTDETSIGAQGRYYLSSCGVYGGLGAKEIHNKKGLKKSQKILDYMGSTELAANLFRATQTEEKLRRDNIKGKQGANQTHYYVGKKVRETIKELGGTMPEDLPTPKSSIKEIEQKSQKTITKKKDFLGGILQWQQTD